MKVGLIRSILVALVAALATLMAGCGGGTGDAGPTGPAGPAGAAWGHRSSGYPGPGWGLRQHRQQRNAGHRRLRRSMGRSGAQGHGDQRDDREPAGGQLHGHRRCRPPGDRAGQHVPEQHGHAARLYEPVVLDGQAGARHQRQPEQVDQLHGDHGTHQERDHGCHHGIGSDAAQHRQHRHVGRPRRRHVHLHVLSRRHADQDPGRRHDRQRSQQQGRPR